MPQELFAPDLALTVVPTAVRRALGSPPGPLVQGTVGTRTGSCG